MTRMKFLGAAVCSLIMLSQPAAMADYTIFVNDEEGFVNFNLKEGKILKLFVDFEFLNIPTGGSQDFGDPFVVPPNLWIQSNSLGERAPMLMPGCGLRALGAGAVAAGVPNSVVMGTRYPGQPPGAPGCPGDSLDLWVPPGHPNHTGVGFDVIDPTAQPRIIEISVFGKAPTGGPEPLIVNFTLEGFNTFQKTFFGIWSSETISRINIAGESALGANNGAEYVDNIQMWIPEPATLSLLGLGALAAARSARIGRGSRAARRAP